VKTIKIKTVLLLSSFVVFSALGSQERFSQKDWYKKEAKRCLKELKGKGKKYSQKVLMNSLSDAYQKGRKNGLKKGLNENLENEIQKLKQKNLFKTFERGKNVGLKEGYKKGFEDGEEQGGLQAERIEVEIPVCEAESDVEEVINQLLERNGKLQAEVEKANDRVKRHRKYSNYFVEENKYLKELLYELPENIISEATEKLSKENKRLEKKLKKK